MSYMKSVFRQGSALVTSTANGHKSGPGSPTPMTPDSKSQLVSRISASYGEIDALNGEKMELAQRIITLLTRTRARLDVDLAKVRTLQGEPAENIRTSYLAASNSLRAGSPFGIKRQDTPIGLAPAIQLGESLRSAISAAQIPESVVSISNASGPGYNKSE